MDLSNENIKDLIKERKITYSIADNAVSAFNRENELSKEYNGRQILELIQNADDANANEIKISINSSSEELSVYNNGDPFNLEGIKSIMIANISSKVTTSYIGNKGLGFRSLLFWAEEIKIISGGYTFSFSPKIAKAVSEELDLNIEHIQKERHLSDKCCPFPILGIPEHEEDKEKRNGCTIILKYKKKYENDIKSQLGLIDGKTILFLKHVRTIIVDYKNEKIPPKKLVVEENDGFFNADGVDWSIKTSSDELPIKFQDPNKSEKKSFEIKIAIPSNRSKETYKLYNYLPTEEPIGLPFIIHATLDLDSSRKHINENEINAFILGKVAEFISNYVDEILKKTNTCDWVAYEMMTPHSPSTDIIHDYFESILVQERDKKKIFPTIGKSYVNKDGYFYNSVEDSQFWNNFNVEKEGIINNILIPFPEHFNIQTRLLNQDKDIDEYTKSLNNIFSNSSLNIDDRVQLIIHLVKSMNSIPLNKQNLMVFIDEKGNVIKSDENTIVFTPKSEEVEYKFPNYIKIHFIKKELYNELLNKLEDTDEFKKIKENNDKLSTSRIFCNVLRIITNVSDYDKDRVLNVIVSQTNHHLDEKLSYDEQVNVIKEMTQCLYIIYQRYNFYIILDSVRLINQEKRIVEASKLLLNTEDNHYVFGDNRDYLLSYDQWGIEDCKNEDFLDFAKHLGVNQLTKESQANENDLLRYANYINSIYKFAEEAIYNPQTMYKAMEEEKFLQMSDLMNELVKDISFTELLYLLASDNDLYEKITQSLQQKQHLKYQYRRIYPFDTEYTYLRHQFLNLQNVYLKVLSNEVVLQDIKENSFPASIQQDRKNTVLYFLTTNLCAVEISEIADLINSLAEQSCPPRIIRKVYKIIVDSLSKDNRSLKYENVCLCAYTGDNENETGYCHVNDIYYSDNISLPKAIVKSLGRKRLYYATRQGAKKICDVFGIEPIEDIYPKIVQDSIKPHQISEEFQKLFNKMKPYFLLYSIQNLDSNEAKRDLANRLKKSKIILVNSAEFELTGQDDHQNLECEEFIQEEDIFYINSSNVSSVKELQDSVKYCNVVAEVLSIITKLGGKSSIYIRIFQNLEFMKQTAEYDFTKDEISETLTLMGVSQEEMNFWNNILPHTSPIDFSDDSFYTEVLKIMDTNSFDFIRVDFLTWTTKESKELLTILNSKLNDVLKHVDLSVLQKNEFDEIKRNRRKSFIHSLWMYLSKVKEKQKNYIEYQQEYEKITFDGDCHIFYTEKDYDVFLKQKVEKLFPNFSWDYQVKPHLCCYPGYDSILPELPIEVQSVFFFEGNSSIIEEKVNEYKKSINEVFVSKDESSDNLCHSNLKILEYSSIKSGNIRTDRKTKNKSNLKTYTEMSNRQKRKVGKDAELLVKNLLETKGYEYHWLSGFSDESNKDDSLGYDFEYRLNEENEWRFLEVKYFSNDSFILSKNEHKKSKELEGRYDIALVKNENVYIIQNFFKSNNYRQEPDSYTVYCQLQESSDY